MKGLETVMVKAEIFKSINKTYIPFLGQRFGLMQIKAAVVNLVLDFEMKVNKKTKIPLEIDPTSLINQPKGGIWLNFYKRRV